MALRSAFICLALLLVTLGVYSQVARFEFVNYDDPDYTAGNSHVRAGLTPASIAWAFTSTYAANWFPLTWLSHMMDREWYGFNAGRQHLTNLALHLLGTMLLFVVLKRMTGSSAASAFAAFVFALHPLHIESVAWIAERKDVLCAVFEFLTIWVYLSYAERPTAWRYLLMVAAFCCALMSKSMAVTLPFVLLLLDVWPLRRFTRASAARLVIEKLPLIALATAASIVTFLAQRGAGAVLDIPLGVRLGNALNSYAFYLVKFVWPSNLAVLYPYEAIPAWQAILAALALAAITALVIWRRTAQPYLAVGWFWYLGTLVPVIGLIQVGAQARADRYTYIPLIGIAIMLACGLKDLAAKRQGPLLGLIAMAACMGWATVTWLDLKYWHDSNALFERAIEVTPDNYAAHSYLGESLWAEGRTDEAISNFQRALSIKPHFAEAEDGLGKALLTDGRVGEAMPHLAESVRREPQSVSAHIDFGAGFSKSGQAREAADQYRIALQLDPESAEAHCGLGVALGEQGRTQEALAQLLESVRINPDYADGRYNLGRVLGLLGRTGEAITQFSEAIRLQPENAEAHYNLGTALAASGKMEAAAEQFRAAVNMKPDYVNARFNYASALANMGEYDVAIPQFQAILRLQPDFKPARESLAQCIELRDHPGAQAPQPGRSQAGYAVRQ